MLVTNTHVCLICLKRFVTEETSRVTIKTEGNINDPVNLGPHNISLPNIATNAVSFKEGVGGYSTTEKTSHDDTQPPPNRTDTYRKFIRFIDRYCKLTTTAEYFTCHANLRKNEDVGKRIRAFCANCEEYVDVICDRHREIEEQQLYLLGKLNSLGDLLKLSTKSMSLKMERSLGKVLAEQLNIKAGTRVVNFRKALLLKCKSRGKRCAPKVLVHRGLFPDQWKFTFSATKRALESLILIFALAQFSAKNTQEIIDINQDEAIPEVTEHASELKVRRLRRNKRKIDRTSTNNTDKNDQENVSDDLQLTKKEENNEELSSDYESPVCGGGDSDPEWSTQAEGPPSPADSDKSSGHKHDSDSNCDPDFDYKAGEKPRTSTRRGGRPTREGPISISNSEPTLMQKRKRRRPRTTEPGQEKKQNFTCSKCPGKFFETHRGLRFHLKQIHRIRADYPCDVCGVMMKNAFQMHRHKLKMHRNKNPKGKQKRNSVSTAGQDFTCTECPEKFFKNLKGLRRHLLLTHRTQIDYPCGVCGVMMKNWMEMHRHKCKMHRTKNRGPKIPRRCTLNSIVKPGRECPICSEMFTSIDGFRQHKKLHTGGRKLQDGEENEEGGEVVKRTRRKFIRIDEKLQRTSLAKLLEVNTERWKICQICDSNEKSCLLLRKHLEKDHEREDEKTLLCYFCTKRFTLQQTLDLHVRAAHTLNLGSIAFYCHFGDDDCGEAFLTWGDLHEHMKQHLEQVADSDMTNPNFSQIYYCSKCGWGTFYDNYVEVHEMGHSEAVDGTYPCPKCAVTFEGIPTLSVHYNRVHGRDVRPFKCKLCGQRSMTKNSLDIHLKRHQEAEDDETNLKTCEEPGCGKSFVGTQKLKLHLQRVHQNNANFQCDVCGKGFFFQSLHKLHMKTHKAPEFECNICKVKFKRRLTMEQHKSRDHMEEEDIRGHIKCTQTECDKKFVSLSLLNRHLARIHQTGPNMCHLCAVVFYRNADLKQHMRSHEEAKFECDICHKQFKRSISLKYHMERLHDPNRVMEENLCTDCGVVFRSMTGLKFHQQSAHTSESERRYPCPNCPKRYHRGALLHLHLRNCKPQDGQGQAVFTLRPKAKGLTAKMKEFRSKQETVSQVAGEQMTDNQNPSTNLDESMKASNSSGVVETVAFAAI